MPHAYRAEVHIDAPPEAVWDVLVDVASYGAWNPFTPDVHTDLTVGGPVRMRVVMGEGRVVKQSQTVREVSPPHRLVWALDRPPRWLIWAERVQTITPESGGSRYETVDTMGGLLAPVVRLGYGRGLRRSFEAMAAALKERVEQARVTA